MVKLKLIEKLNNKRIKSVCRLIYGIIQGLKVVKQLNYNIIDKNLKY
jgi:hypothetical protein